MNLRFVLGALALIGFFSFQSFQCASPDMTTGKLAYNQKDFAKAKTYLEREVAKNPSNAEAQYFLADCNKNLKDFEAAIGNLAKAREFAKTDKLKKEVSYLSYSIWGEMYNTSITGYNQVMEKREGASAQDVEKSLTLAFKLKPENLETEVLRGNLRLVQGDTTGAIEAYKAYVDGMKPSIDFAKANGVILGQSRQELIKVLGSPAASKGFGDRTGDTTLIDRFVKGGTEAYVFSSGKGAELAKVEGWRVNLPAFWINEEKERYINLSLRPLLSLADIYNRKRNFEEAVKYLNIASMVSPGDEDVTTYKIQIYQEQGKIDLVANELSDLVRQFPDNNRYRAVYADVLSRTGKGAAAVAEYENILKRDPNFENALYNLGAYYINQASELQQSERAKMDKDPKYRENESLYADPLGRAATYFERYRQLPNQRTNIEALKNLATIYNVLKNKDRLRQAISDLEAQESNNASDPDYYYFMIKMYDSQGMKEKRQEMERKLESIK